MIQLKMLSSYIVGREEKPVADMDKCTVFYTQTFSGTKWVWKPWFRKG